MITSDAGVLLPRELEERLRIIARLTECFEGHRNPDYFEHTVEELLRQRIFGLARREETGEAVRFFDDFQYRTKHSWSRSRRIIAKVEQTPQGPNLRYVVTSLNEDDVCTKSRLRGHLLPAWRGRKPH